MVPLLETFAVAGWLGICVAWAALLLAQVRAKRRGLFLESPSVAPNSGSVRPSPSVCVVIPARNEERQIACCLSSVLNQEYPAFEVVVVDDRSSDGTGEIVSEVAASDSRLRLLRNDDLPSGWLGKSHALWQATQAITAEWILFLDADCELDPSALRVAVDEAVGRGVGLLSLWPRIRAESFFEHLMIPLCAGIIALWYGSNRVNTADSTLAFANGQFLLIRREAYERIGGHRGVRLALIEDVPLAEAAKRSRVECHVACGRQLFSVRMYDSYSAIREGWARIYVGALRSGSRIAASLAWLALGSLLPFVAALVLFAPPATSLVLSGIGSPLLLMMRICCALHIALLFIVSCRFWGFGGCRRSYLALYPLSVILVMRILCRAWCDLVLRRSVSWSMTRYNIDHRGSIIDVQGQSA